MRRKMMLGLALLALFAGVSRLSSQQNGEPTAPATIRVTLPENARLEIEGVQTKQTGAVRIFESPALAPNKKYNYTLKARWVEGGKEVLREQTLRVEAGRESAVDLRQAAPVEATLLAAAQDKKKPRRQPDVIYVPTPQEVVDKMLEVAKVTKDDILFDLGCGDARIPTTAARKYGCKSWGFDIDPQRIKDSMATRAKEKADVQKLITIEEKDIFTLDLSKASVVTLYLLPELNVKLIPQLEKLKPGSRIVSHDFDMEGVKPDQHITMKVNEVEHEIYLWTVPLKKEKK